MPQGSVGEVGSKKDAIVRNVSHAARYPPFTAKVSSHRRVLSTVQRGDAPALIVAKVEGDEGLIGTPCKHVDALTTENSLLTRVEHFRTNPFFPFRGCAEYFLELLRSAVQISVGRGYENRPSTNVGPFCEDWPASPSGFFSGFLYFATDAVTDESFRFPYIVRTVLGSLSFTPFFTPSRFTLSLTYTSQILRAQFAFKCPDRSGPL